MTQEEEYILSQYECLQEISQAGSQVNSRVFLVRNRQDGKIYIRKELPVAERAIFEKMRICSQMRGIPRIYHVIAEDDTKIIVIEEHLNHPTLDDLMKKLSVDDVRMIFIKLCRIMQQLHSCYPCIVHRDIKPENIMVDLSGLHTKDAYSGVYVIDFGAARHVEEGQTRDTRLMGTIDYAAPEQYGFAQSDARTDIYGIGATLNVCIETVFSYITTQEENESLNQMRRVVLTATQMAPADRFQSCKEMEDALIIGLPDRYFEDDKAQKKRRRKEEIKHSPLPPGFRSKNPIHMVVAVVGYAFIAMVAGSDNFREPSIIFTMIERILVCGSLLSQVFIVTNYLDVQSKLPLVGHKNIFVRLFGFAISMIGAFFIFIMIAALIEILFFNR
ncbi:MAG: serine/threonine protein kinase [Wujia sp.]